MTIYLRRVHEEFKVWFVHLQEFGTLDSERFSYV